MGAQNSARPSYPISRYLAVFVVCNVTTLSLPVAGNLCPTSVNLDLFCQTSFSSEHPLSLIAYIRLTYNFIYQQCVQQLLLLSGKSLSVRGGRRRGVQHFRPEL